MRTAADADAALRALFDDVEARPWSHDFFALLRRLEGLRPRAPRVGRASRPGQEALRLGQEPELDFAPAALANFERRGGPAAPRQEGGREAGEGGLPDALPPRLGVRFFGLFGPQGALPLHLTEYARERLRQRGDPTLVRFLDVFHHRLLSLFYRAWAQAQPTAQHDRPADDRYAAWLGAAVGLDGDLRPQDTVPQGARLFRAGLLGGRGRHPEGLVKILSSHFDVPVRVEPHVAQWLVMDAADRTRLGHARNRPERVSATSGRLGRDANAGSKCWDRQYKFRLVLGPLTLAQYGDFLPGGRAWPSLRDWVRQYVGLDLRWDLELRLAAAEVPPPRLGAPLRLGVNGWLARAGGRPHGRDAGDFHLRPHTAFLLRLAGEPS